MGSLFLPLASADNPLAHVVDHRFGGFLDTIGITKHVLYVFVAAALCMLVFPWVTRRIATDGTGGRWATFFESMLLFIREEVARPFLGKDTNRFIPIIWSFFFFILFCNLLGMLPIIGATATGNINVTAALAVVAFLFYHGIGIQRNGFVRYLKATFLVGPVYLWPLMILIEAMGHVIRPCALAIRLFANMVAGHTMLAVFFMFCVMAVKSGHFLVMGTIPVAAVLATVGITFLELLVAFIQAFIFTFLTTVFLSMAIHPEH